MNYYVQLIAYNRFANFLFRLIIFIIIFIIFIIFSLMFNEPVYAMGPDTDLDMNEGSNVVPSDSENDSDSNQDNKKLDKGKGKMIENEEDDTESALLEYWYNLLGQRDELIEEYEQANRNFNKSGSSQDEASLRYIEKLIDNLDNEIEDLKDQKGYIDPKDIEDSSSSEDDRHINKKSRKD